MTSQDEQPQQEAGFRQYLPDLSTPRFIALGQNDAYSHARELTEKHNPPWLYGLYTHWQKLLQEPFKGITNDGTVRPGLYALRDEGLPITEIVAAANTLTSHLTPSQRARTIHHIDSPIWRTWSNPEFLVSDHGLRLDELSAPTLASLLALLSETLSPAGYRKALATMHTNHFLGSLVGAPKILNQHSYNFLLFGSPSTTRPWGFSLYGHHLCLAAFLHRSQLVLSPCFTGAEPNLIDAGPHQGTRILHLEERLGLQLMQSLPGPLQARARTYPLMKDPAMPPGRWNHDDQRHLCGAYRDNRVVPYEGVLVSSLRPQQQDLVLEILEEYLLYLPARSRDLRLADIKAFFDETYFSWIGGNGDNDPFYYRIQSPVIIVEFDHHSGVFLTNEEPAKFHIHTILRTPNGGDYGWALRNQIEGIDQDYVWTG
ncbi:hypothetical protein GGR50DRAFT_692164 [Xylaria sp. CBS 124048]|nr:hypothetical protein GGR50DRAFT_692164 [Xylaria sp. CBS 124048]